MENNDSAPETTNNMNVSSGSGANTTLIVVVLVILVALGVWWFSARDEAVTVPVEENPSELNVDLNLPEGGDDSMMDDGSAQ